MNNVVAGVVIPGNNLMNNKCRNGEMDVLMFSSNNEYITIRDDDELIKLKSTLEEKEIEESNSILYHLDLIKKYLSKECSEIKSLNLNRFNVNNSFALYKILASAGNIIILNSEYVVPIFLPKRVSQEQIVALERVTEIIDNENIEAVFIDANLNQTDEVIGNLEEVIEHIKSMKKGM